jgi:hypothetical protein
MTENYALSSRACFDVIEPEARNYGCKKTISEKHDELFA